MASLRCRSDDGADRHRRMASLFLRATAREADGLSETKKEEHDRSNTDSPCRCFRRMILISPARAPVDGEAGGKGRPAEAGVESH